MRFTVIMLLAASPILAALGGSIAGTITDQSGAAMPEVSVLARNADTGVQRRAATNEQGFYAFPDLAIGSLHAGGRAQRLQAIFPDGIGSGFERRPAGRYRVGTG